MKRAASVSLIILLAACAPSKNMAPVYRYGVSSGAGSLGAHTVQAGDSVWTIAQKYNLDLRGIIEVNHLSPPYALQKGSRVNLPAPKTYTVRSRDNIYTVSRLFNTTQTEMASLNRLAPPFKLKAGQVLRVPTGYGSDPVVTADMPSVNMSMGAMPAKVESVSLPPVNANGKEVLPMPPQPQPQPQLQSVAPALQKAQNSSAPLPRSGKFLKPVQGKIISGYGSKADGQHNDGINIQAARGDAVRAAENGQIVYVGNEIEGYGNMILMRHGDQYMTAYSHLDKSLVKKGDTIRRGQAIGTVGSTGLVDKPQLHFEIRKGKKAIDPAGLL